MSDLDYRACAEYIVEHDDTATAANALRTAADEIQQLREALLAADNALQWVADHYPAALRELPTPEYQALLRAETALARVEKSESAGRNADEELRARSEIMGTHPSSAVEKSE